MIRFRLFPTRRATMYVVVTVLKTKRDFQQYVRRRGRACGQATAAVNMARTGQGDCPRGHQRAFSEIATYRSWLKRRAVTTVTHELAHATFQYAAVHGFRQALTAAQPVHAIRPRGGFMDTNAPEERYCYAIGYMARQFVDQLYKAGILKD